MTPNQNPPLSRIHIIKYIRTWCSSTWVTQQKCISNDRIISRTRSINNVIKHLHHSILIFISVWCFIHSPVSDYRIVMLTRIGHIFRIFSLFRCRFSYSLLIFFFVHVAYMNVSSSKSEGAYIGYSRLNSFAFSVHSFRLLLSILTISFVALNFSWIYKHGYERMIVEHIHQCVYMSTSNACDADQKTF